MDDPQPVALDVFAALESIAVAPDDVAQTFGTAATGPLSGWWCADTSPLDGVMAARVVAVRLPRKTKKALGKVNRRRLRPGDIRRIARTVFEPVFDE
jgi:hypothetical protein